jgi:glycosyltransferase involved in cell wall biosynthesis
MPRIIIEADSIVAPKISGIGHATLEIIRALDTIAQNQADVQVSIVVPFEKRAIAKQYGFKKIRIRTLPPPYKYINYLVCRILPVPMDLWYGRGVYIFVNYKNWSVPFSHSITFIQDMAYKIFPETIHPKALSYLQAHVPKWIGRTDVVAVTSKATQQEFNSFFPEYADKVKVIPLGANPDVFYPRTVEEIEGVCKTYALPKDYFLVLGNLEPRKNIAKLLDSYVTYCAIAKNPAALVMVGADGWRNEALRDRISKLQAEGYQIVFPSSFVIDEHLPALYSGARALLQLSLHEGFGLPPIQSLACGTAVIASDLAVFHELLGNNATFVDANNPGEVAKQMVNTSTQKQAPIATLTWQQTAKKLLEVAGIQEMKK